MNIAYNNKCNTADEIAERHEREFDTFNRLTEPEKIKYQVRLRALYEQDPWAFLADCVFTLDQVSENNPIKSFPTHLDYLEFLCRLWQRERLLGLPKSRRMICSWLFISLYLWDTLFKPGRFNAFVSKKEDDSGELVARAEFIYRHIPTWRIPPITLPKIANGKMSKQPPLLSFEEMHSKIQGFPQGSDQLRQFTFSGLLFDEWAFWECAQSAYSGAKPTIDGGGRLTGISSRSPGFFKKIVFDQLDAVDLTFLETPPVEIKRPLTGIELWKNPKNKFVIADLHYTANPDKRSIEWLESIRNSMPKRDFEMEYERSWQTFEGKPVYEDYKKVLHAARGLIIEPGIPLLLGWDFGLTPACLICQLIGRRLRIYREILETNGSISKLAPIVMNILKTLYLPWIHHADHMIISYVDPAGFQRAQTDENTCVKVMRTHGFIRILPGPVGWEERRRAVENPLTKIYADGPGLLIDEELCPVLVEGFGGGYRYPEKSIEIEPAKIQPLKNKYSHPHDALQYVAAGASTLRSEYAIDMPIPTYGFQLGGNGHAKTNR